MNRIALSESANRMNAPERHPRPGPFVRAMFFVGLLFHFGGAFTIQLEFSGTQHSTSKLLQITYLVFGLFGAVMLFNAPKAAKRIISQCKPVFFLLALTFASVLWSTSPGMTLKACFAYLMTNAFALALPACLDDEALPFLIRSMAFGCLLSILWIFIFPQTAVHQATDIVQSVHAGLWRGIFTHKQSLGTFAGFSTALCLFYGRLAFSNILLRIGAIACSVICVWGSGSATGIVMATVLTALLYVTYAIAKMPPTSRKGAVIAFFVVMLGIWALFRIDALSFVTSMLGKSDDMSGRSGTWQLISNNFAGSGARIIFGGGFASDFRWAMSEGLPIDSGYFLKLLDFGYAGSLLLILAYGQMFRDSVILLIRAERKFERLAVFPLSMFIILMIYSITETGLMERHVTTLLVTIAVYIMASKRTPALAPAPQAPKTVRLGMRPAPTRYWKGGSA